MSKKQLYIGSAILVTIGMLVMKGIATLVNAVVALVLA